MAAVLVKPVNWKAGSPIYNQLALGNDYFTVNNAGSGYTFDSKATYALTSTDNNTLRFEVHPGDNNWYDGKGGSERSEIESNEWIGHGTAFEVAYKFTLEPGAANTAKWFAIGQLQEEHVEGQAARSPEVSIELLGEKMRIVTRGNNPNGSVYTNVIYQDANNIQRGHDYDIRIVGVIDPSGTSRLVVMRDGKAIVDFEGSIGYTDRTQIHWKEGLYRSPSKEVVAATYSDLEINHGDMVKVPSKESLVLATADAPTLNYGAQGKLVDGKLTASVTGDAVAGQKVTIYDGEKAVAWTVAKADGSYAVDVAGLASGTHKLTATTSNQYGQLSHVSGELVFEVGTGAQLLGRLEYVSAKDNVGAIFLTDSHTITVSSIAQMQSMLTNDQHVLDLIDGGYDFQFWSGTANNRTHFSYDAKGVLVESDTTLYVDGTLSRKTFQYYGGDDAIAKEVYQYGIAGKAWVSTYQAFDKAGAMIVSTRSHADGTLDYSSVVAADGATTIKTFDAAGKMLTKTVQSTDNGKLIENYNSAGIATYRYELSASGKAVTTTFDAKGVIASSFVNNPDKSSESSTYTGGQLTTKVVNHAANDGSGMSREVFTYAVKNATYTDVYQVFSTTGKLVSTLRTHADGTPDYLSRVATDGTTITETYNAKSVISTRVTVLSNKTTDTQVFVNGVLKTETINYPAGSDPNKIKLVYEFHVEGQSYGSKLTTYNNYNKVVATEQFAQAVVKTPLSAVIGDAVATPSLELHTSVQVAARFAAAATSTAVSQNAELHDGHLDAPLSGSATAGSTVKIYDGRTLIGTAKADASGTFSFQAEGLGAGSHVLTAVGVNDFGNTSSPSNPLVLAVVTADDFVAQLKTLADTNGLAGVWLVGDRALSVPAGDLAGLLAQYGKVFGAIHGDYGFRSWSGTGDQRTLSTFDEHGTLTSTHAYVYSNGKVVGETVTSGGSGAEYAREVYSYGIVGKAWTSTRDAYDANGNLVLSTRSHADGSLDFRMVRETDGTVIKEEYDAKGQMTLRFAAEANGSSTTETNNGTTGVASRYFKDADGSSHSSIYANGVLVSDTIMRFSNEALSQKEVFEYGLTGRSYTSSHSVFDASGTAVLTERFHADKTFDYSFLRNADGSTVTSVYDGVGNLAKKTVMNADPTAATGAKEVFNFGITGKDYVSEHVAYDQAGRTLLTDRGHADGGHDVTLRATNVKAISTAADEDFFSFRRDSFVFGKDFGKDTVHNFNAGAGASHDTLIFEKGMFAKDDPLAAAMQVGNDIVITTLDHDTVTLVNIQKIDLVKADFLIV